MEPYKPKRIDIHLFDGYNKSLGICITREQWNYEGFLYKDYYLYINLYWLNFTLVFLRFETILKTSNPLI